METIAIVTVQTLCVMGGICTLYFALLSYETEDKKLQTVLEAWWVKLDDAQRDQFNFARRWHSQSSEIAARFLAVWLGEPTDYRRLALISINLSAFALCLLLAISVPLPWALCPATLAALLLWAALYPLRNGKPPRLLTAASLCTSFVPLVFGYFDAQTQKWSHLLPLGLLSGYITCALSIHSAKQLISASRQRGLFFVLALPLFVAAGVLLCTLLLGVFMGPFGWILIPIMSIPALAVSIFPLLQPVIHFLATGLSALAARSIYSVQRHQVAVSKKTLWALTVIQFSVLPIGKHVLSLLKLAS